MTKALTVGQLRKAIARLPDSVEVVIDTNGWYDNIQAVIVPSTKTHHSDYVAVTLMPATMPATITGGDWDARQAVYAQPADIIRPTAEVVK